MPAPIAAVPLPAGKPAPSGPMLMSQPAMSCAVTGIPRFGPSCASANVSVVSAPTPAANASPFVAIALAAINLYVDIADLPRSRDVPALDRVVVIAVVRAARADQCRAGGLNRTGVVDRAAHQHARAAVPAPRHPEAHRGLRL